MQGQAVWLGCGLDYWGSIPGNAWSGRGVNLITRVHLMTIDIVDGVLRASYAIP